MYTVEIKNFKKFDNIKFEISNKDVTLVAGANNSGKTSILHALAVWEYAKILLVNFKGGQSLLKDYKATNGLGVSPGLFSPISIPSLKYLWKDQKTNGSYNLKIKVGWIESGVDKHLEIAYTLTGNNFSIKKSSSNLVDGDTLPTIAYLPPFGGMAETESLLSVADRRKLIGKGQAGSVIRNLLLDLYVSHKKELSEKKASLLNGVSRKLKKAEKETLSKIETNWIRLNAILYDIFDVELHVDNFDSQFHNKITVYVQDVVKGVVKKNGEEIEKTTRSNKRDLMVEGSGFLQWISVFSLALDKENDILLLDEPDAHLHSSLQTLLLNKLEAICTKSNKTILMVSHSTDLIKDIRHDKILHVSAGEALYLNSDNEKELVLRGLGSQYIEKFEMILKHKKLLFVENDSDYRYIKYFCEILGKEAPKNLVPWATTKSHKDRRSIASEFNKIIYSGTGDGILAYSLRDLDSDEYNKTNKCLYDNGSESFKDDYGRCFFKPRTLRRREIENYLIIPSAMARYINNTKAASAKRVDEDSIHSYLSKNYGLTVPADYRLSERGMASEGLFSNDVKSVLEGINKEFKVKFKKDDYVKSIKREEVCEDILTIVNELIDMCNSN